MRKKVEGLVCGLASIVLMGAFIYLGLFYVPLNVKRQTSKVLNSTEKWNYVLDRVSQTLLAENPDLSMDEVTDKLDYVEGFSKDKEYYFKVYSHYDFRKNGHSHNRIDRIEIRKKPAVRYNSVS